jgi:hypothetical protein
MSEPAWAPILADCQTDTLVVLVGKNPLPNYVVAHLLLRPGGQLFLVHTRGPRGTGDVAQRLARQCSGFRPQLVAVDPADTEGLRRTVRSYLEKATSGAIGLNYTGGTKVMAVHAYRATEEYCRDQHREAVSSYLDADTLELAVEPRPGKPAIRVRVVDALSIPMRRVFELHGLRVSQSHVQPRLPELARALATLHATPKGHKIWTGCRSLLEPSQRSWPDTSAELLRAGAAGVASALDPLCRDLDPDAGETILSKVATVGIKSVKEWRTHLQGTWLEEWTLSCVRGAGYTECAGSLKGYTPRLFEIDVAVMRGYQLFAISCATTGDRGKAKQKLFEVFVRAQQIGGEEARAAVVCPGIEDTDALRQEVEYEWEAANRIRVFGRREIADLDRHIKEWIEAV